MQSYSVSKTVSARLVCVCDMSEFAVNSHANDDEGAFQIEWFPSYSSAQLVEQSNAAIRTHAAAHVDSGAQSEEALRKVVAEQQIHIEKLISQLDAVSAELEVID
jgi:hypothetical protein